MKHDVERYLQASTRRSDQQAIEHFEVSRGGFLLATSDAIVRYLVDRAGTLSCAAYRWSTSKCEWERASHYSRPADARPYRTR